MIENAVSKVLGFSRNGLHSLTSHLISSGYSRRALSRVSALHAVGRSLFFVCELPPRLSSWVSWISLLGSLSVLMEPYKKYIFWVLVTYWALHPSLPPSPSLPLLGSGPSTSHVILFSMWCAGCCCTSRLQPRSLGHVCLVLFESAHLESLHIIHHWRLAILISCITEHVLCVLWESWVLEVLKLVRGCNIELLISRHLEDVFLGCLWSWSPEFLNILISLYVNFWLSWSHEDCNLVVLIWLEL